MKKRDLYIAIILLSVVGYAASVRINNNSKRTSEENKIGEAEEIRSPKIDQENSENKSTDTIKWVETPKSERLSSSALISK